MPLLLEQAIVRRVDLADSLAAIEVRSPGETVIVIVGIARGVRGVGIVDSDARRAAWGTRLPAGAVRVRGDAGARVEAGHVVGISLRALDVEKEGARRVVAIEGARVVVTDGATGDLAEDAERAAFEARGRELLAALAEEAHERRRERVVRAIAKGVTRVERRIGAMQADLARLADAETLAAQAQWLVVEAARAPRGARSLKVTDWTTGEARVLEVPLDPSKPPRAQVEAMFTRARRLKRGAKIAEERIAKAEIAKRTLVQAIEDARGADDAEMLDVALARARGAAPKDVSLEGAESAAGPPRAAAKSGKGPPFRTFVTPSGARILVGKGAAQNDALTFQTARPHDLWLHAKGRTGAHVVVPLAKNTTCPGELLVDAAHLAAHFSDARGEGVVDVSYTPRRYLRKPRGSAPGLVVVDREKVLPVRLETGRVERLLESEE